MVKTKKIIKSRKSKTRKSKSIKSKTRKSKSIKPKTKKAKKKSNSQIKKDIKDMEKIFKQYPEVFPSGYFKFFNASMAGKIKNKEIEFNDKDGVILTWKVYKKSSMLHTKEFPLRPGDVKVNQLVNRTPGNGKAKEIFMKFLKKHKGKNVYLDVRSDNPRAINFYKKNNFKKIGEVVVGKEKLKMTIMKRNPE